MRVRIRSAAATTTATFDQAATFSELSERIEALGVPPPYKLLSGYPPSALEFHPDSPLSSLISSGDTIIVEPATQDAAAPPAPTAVQRSTEATISPPTQPIQTNGDTADGEQIVRRVIAADNSCLFNAVSYVLEGGQARPKGRAPALRQVVSQAVLADPIRYDAATLGRAPDEYAKWIKQDASWGGAIELSVLSEHFRTEIAAFDVQTCRVDVFGQGQGYAQRAFLIYDGVHYDALAKTLFSGAPPELDVTVFDVLDEVAMAQGRLVASKAKAARQFTDTASFTIRCLVCQKGLVGENDAVEHAKATGHTNFSEYEARP